jgi:hypothetical protein
MLAAARRSAVAAFRFPCDEEKNDRQFGDGAKQHKTGETSKVKYFKLHDHKYYRTHPPHIHPALSLPTHAQLNLQTHATKLPSQNMLRACRTCL